jgi:hypothetical protein
MRVRPLFLRAAIRERPVASFRGVSVTADATSPGRVIIACSYPLESGEKCTRSRRRRAGPVSVRGRAHAEAGSLSRRPGSETG